MNKIISEVFLKTTGHRFFWLCASIPVGVLLLWLFNDIVDKYPEYKSLDKLGILVALFPTGIAGAFLWWFRTYDMKQNLKQSKGTHDQNEWVDGLNKLISDEPLNIDLGVEKLIALSKTDDSYDDDIHLAFIKRLKHLPSEYAEHAENFKKPLEENEDKAIYEWKQNLPYLTYAQHILPWFKDKKRELKDIDDVHFDFQEFALDVYGKKENPLVCFLQGRDSPTKITFIHANLEGADLQAADLYRANLEGANLRRADLRRADLEGADLRGVNLEGADLQAADLYRADLRRADLRGAKLQDVKLQDVKLQYASLEGADLQAADLKGVDLQAADLEGADLRWAKLQGAKLQGADLRGAKLRGVKLRGVKLRGVKLLGLQFRRVDLQTGYLLDAQLEGANFLGAKLQGATLPNEIVRYLKEK